MRFILIFLALALVLAVPFFIWGGGRKGLASGGSEEYNLNDGRPVSP